MKINVLFIRKSVTVDKQIPVNYDLGNLAVLDPQPLEANKISNIDTKEDYLKSITRDNVQLLINQILSLPLKKSALNSENSSGSVITLVELPNPIFQLPREKSIPKTKKLTKWEQFAAKKGISKKGKESKLIFDESKGEWVNKWGYNGKNKEVDSQWAVEVDESNEKSNEDGELIDPRKLNRLERKSLVKKNLLQQKRNLQK